LREGEDKSCNTSTSAWHFVGVNENKKKLGSCSGAKSKGRPRNLTEGPGRKGLSRTRRTQ